MLYIVEIRRKNFLVESKPNIIPIRNKNFDDSQKKTKRRTKTASTPLATRLKISLGVCLWFSLQGQIKVLEVLFYFLKKFRTSLVLSQKSFPGSYKPQNLQFGQI